MNDIPILTIAIPTYERSYALEQRLNEIHQQYDTRLCVLVSDNCSSDNTETVVQHHRQIMPYLQYHRNEHNLGFDGNILKLYELATTPYIWFLSDDDAVLEDSVCNVLEAINTWNPSVGVFCFEDSDDHFRKHPVSGSRTTIVHNSVEDLPSPLEIFRTVFISTLVVKRSPFVKVDDLHFSVGTGLVHVALSLALLSYQFRFCLLPSTIVRRIPEYRGSSDADMLKLFYIDAYKAVNIPNATIGVSPFKKALIKDSSCLKTLLANKSGLMKYRWEHPIRSESLNEIYKIWGIDSLPFFLGLFLVVLTPRWLMRLFYLSKLIREFGWHQGLVSYKQLVASSSLRNSVSQ